MSRSRPKDERGDTGAAPRPPTAFVGGPRRVDVLDRARRPLTVLVAPPGSGKTATLAVWAAARDTPPVWLDGRRADDRAALADICAGRRQDRVLVVDDAHELTTAELEAVIGAVTRGDLGVVLAARRDLPIPVVALDLSDQLSVLRGDHLRLTPEETTELVRAHAPDADAADVAAVAARAHGWAAAVVLAAHALSSAADRETARAALVATDQPILDYLLDEVFSALPATTRHVLVCTAHEEQVTDTSARVLSADDEAGGRLAQLAVDGMFVTRYDDLARDEPVWVYHPLLVELLHRETARGTPDAVLVAAAHVRAARYYAAVGDPVPALRHAVASDDDALVAELLVRLGPRLLAAGHHPVVRRALQTVPVALRTGSPGVSAIDALERQAVGDVEAVLRLVAEQAAGRAEDETGVASRVAPLAALVRADETRVRLWLTRAGMGDTRGAAAEAERLLVDASAGRGAGALDATRSSALHAELAYARLLLDDTAGASWHAQQAAALGRAVGTPLIEADALAVNAVLELLAGRFQTAAAEARSGLDLVRSGAAVTAVDGREHRAGRSDADGHRAPDRVRPAAPEAVLHAVLGWAAYYALDPAEARRQLDLARRRLDPTVDPIAAALVRQLGALVLADEGDVPLARRVVASDAGLPLVPPFLRAIHELVRGQLALGAGDVAGARAGAAAVREHGWEGEARVLEAAIELAAGDQDQVRERVTPLSDAVGGVGGDRAEACAAAASAFDLVLCLPWGAGRVPEEAHGRLRDLLSRCAPQRLTRLFLVPLAHPAFLPLLEQEVEEGTSGAFAADALAALSAWPAAQSSAGRIAPSGTSNVLAIRQGKPGTSRPALQAVPSPVRPPAPRRPSGPAADAQFRYVPEAEQAAPRAPVPPLTSREVEVLGRLARGDSYLDIAQALYITQNTVKTHVAALYRKLNAGKRSEALRTAWALGLLTEIAPASPDPGQARA